MQHAHNQLDLISTTLIGVKFNPEVNTQRDTNFKRIRFYKWAQLLDLRASTKRLSDSQHDPELFYPK